MDVSVEFVCTRRPGWQSGVRQRSRGPSESRWGGEHGGAPPVGREQGGRWGRGATTFLKAFVKQKTKLPGPIFWAQSSPGSSCYFSVLAKIHQRILCKWTPFLYIAQLPLILLHVKHFLNTHFCTFSPHTHKSNTTSFLSTGTIRIKYLFCCIPIQLVITGVTLKCSFLKSFSCLQHSAQNCSSTEPL